MRVVLKYQDEEFSDPSSTPLDLEEAVVLLQRQLAHRRASAIMRQPALPAKSARRPRPFTMQSSNESYCASSDGESVGPASPTLSTMGTTDVAVESIRNVLHTSIDRRQHSAQSSFSSTSSGPPSDGQSSRRSSFDWNSLDTSIAALIEDGAREKERTQQSEHRDAALKYRRSRQLRNLSRQQKQFSLLL